MPQLPFEVTVMKGAARLKWVVPYLYSQDTVAVVELFGFEL
jgi:hypothetical protein